MHKRLNFFKPLTGKYREQIAQCLCLLYQRQYSSAADYGHSLNRGQLLEILEEALAKLNAKTSAFRTLLRVPEMHVSRIRKYNGNIIDEIGQLRTQQIDLK